MSQEFIIEDRAGDPEGETHFGFVYLGEEQRAFYTVTKDELTIGGPGSGYFRPFTGSQLKAAKQALIDRWGLVTA